MTIIDLYKKHGKEIPDRSSGYYWVRFPGRDWWEPGSWDNKEKYWMLIGSVEPWLDFQIEVGKLIPGRPGVIMS